MSDTASPKLSGAEQAAVLLMSLGEDAAAQPGENGNQRAAEGQPDQRVDGVLDAHLQQDAIQARHTQQTHSDHQHAGDGAAAESDLHGGVELVIGGFRGSYVGSYRYIHADIAGQSGVKIVGIRPIGKKEYEPKEKGERYQEIPIEIVAISGYHALGKFLQKLEMGERFIMIKDLEVTASKNNMKRHDVSIIASTFILIGK